MREHRPRSRASKRMRRADSADMESRALGFPALSDFSSQPLRAETHRSSTHRLTHANLGASREDASAVVAREADEGKGAIQGEGAKTPAEDGAMASRRARAPTG